MKTVVEIITKLGCYAGIFWLAHTFPKTICVILGVLFVAAFATIYTYLETHERY